MITATLGCNRNILQQIFAACSSVARIMGAQSTPISDPIEDDVAAAKLR